MNRRAWEFEDLDLVRALLSALSWREQDVVTPVSTTSIHHELVRRNRTIRAADALADLAGIGDAQRLDHGYWLPCPTHGATDGGLVVLVSSEPTEALAASIGASIHRGGIGRFLSGGQALKRPVARVSISQWLSTPPSSPEWLKNYLESAAFAPPIQMEDAEVYRHWRGPIGRRWLRLADGLVSDERHLLGRVGGPNSRRYMILKASRGHLTGFHEPKLGFDLARTICALQAMSGDPIRVVAQADEKRDRLSLASPIVPDRESAFLQCLGSVHVSESSSKVEADLPLEAHADVYRVFTALGCKVQETRR